jgi:multidrug resistance efflux pump
MKNKLIVLVTTSILLASCASKNEVTPVVKDIKELIFASGELQWDNTYNLTAQTDGIINNANFDVGDSVNKGNTLALIDNKTNENNTQTAQEQLVIANQNVTLSSPAIEQLQQNIYYAKSKYEQDKTQAERYQRLYNSQSIAKLELENIQLQTKNSLAQFNALQKQKEQLLQQAHQQQITIKNQTDNSKVIENYNKIVVTESGTVIKKIKYNGDYVKKGDVIATIANNKKIEIVLNVDENSIAKIKVGQPVFVQLNTNKNKVYNGSVSEILTAFDEKTQSFICKVLLTETLTNSIFGTQLEANILVNEKKSALLIPRKYLGFGNAVTVKGKSEAVIVTTGIVSTEYVEVLSGLSKDDVLELKKP